ncbi:receptor-like protein 56 [Quercus suber]|uniref:Receptor-like protein 56 n=1 Tax=Quercus suber TaxID=58331 RepID=A0AAW0JI05_QUESU
MGRSLVKCLLWGLIVLVHLHGHRGCFEDERKGLLEIKEFVRSSPNITDHHLLHSWVDEPESECCEWERVACNSTTGHVTQLSLHNIRDLYFYCDEFYYYDRKNIIWFLNVSLFETFQELKSLNLSCNAIGGWIENEDSRMKLERLDLGSNMFNRSIIQSLRLFKSLKTLSLPDNSLEGSFPAKELSVFEDLEMLDLSNNEFNGSLTVQDKR